MALNIKDPVAEELATSVAELAGESKTEAVRVALRERRERLRLQAGASVPSRRLRKFLANEAWPQIPGEVLGRVIEKAEREEILGYGDEGV